MTEDETILFRYLLGLFICHLFCVFLMITMEPVKGYYLNLMHLLRNRGKIQVKFSAQFQM